MTPEEEAYWKYKNEDMGDFVFDANTIKEAIFIFGGLLGAILAGIWFVTSFVTF